MEIFYLFIVVVLIVLAISDLIVGVSNDAVNFVNSAVGSKAGSFIAVMIIAAVGVLVGATFSSGMMEIARKGIFNPEFFHFNEIMIIFLAVMITDVILLDLFNTAGLPTSTTVSLVFELLGAAFAISTVKIIESGGSMQQYAEYINTGKVFAIISGILLSIAIGFSVAAMIQYLVRMVFTFQYEKRIKYYGSLWGGISLTTIVYFLFIKGAKGSSFMTPEVVQWFLQNTWMILLGNLIGWTIIFQLLYWLFKINILKVVVFTGTFSLAMAFAGNDLVNFIGVPLAGLESYQVFHASGSATPGDFTMEVLNNPVRTPTFLLLIAGLIMLATLFLSKKARSVTKTTIDLGRQEAGDEQFHSSALARGIVLIALQVNKGVSYLVPAVVQRKIESRFTLPSKRRSKKEKPPAFDLVRASVILIVSSILIALGTSLKLPLSTTYITFMVAMGASLSDRAWGRETAVFRVNGVITVIGGWFFTALIAFTVSFILALVIWFGGMVAIICLILLAFFFVYKTHGIHKKKMAEDRAIEEIEASDQLLDSSSMFGKCESAISTFAEKSSTIYENLISSLVDEKRRQLAQQGSELKELHKEIKSRKKLFHKVIRKIDDNSIEGGYYYMQVFSQLKEAFYSLQEVFHPIHDYIVNSHPPFSVERQTELQFLKDTMQTYFSRISEIVRSKDYANIQSLDPVRSDVNLYIEKMKIHQIQMIKQDEISARQSMLMIDILTDTKNLVDQMAYTLDIQRKFYKTIQKIKN